MAPGLLSHRALRSSIVRMSSLSGIRTSVLVSEPMAKHTLACEARFWIEYERISHTPRRTPMPRRSAPPAPSMPDLIGDNVRRFRIAHGWQQGDLADRLKKHGLTRMDRTIVGKI